jgi:hypothetical protein
MPIQHAVNNTAFDPEAVKALTAVYDDVWAALGLVGRTDPLTQRVAKKIMDYATRGERDPIQLRQIVLGELRARGSVTSESPSASMNCRRPM